MYLYQCTSFFVAKDEEIELSGIFFLKNQIGLKSVTGYNYSNIIFKIENKKVSTAFNETRIHNNLIYGYPVVYNQETKKAVNIGRTWAATESDLRKFLNELSEQFIEIIYELYGKTFEYESYNDDIWSITGIIDDIQEIGYETKNSIRMRSATYHK